MARDELTTAYLNELYIIKVIMFKPHHIKVDSPSFSFWNTVLEQQNNVNSSLLTSEVSIFYRMIRNYEGSVNMHYLMHMFRTQLYLLPNIINNNY